MDDADMRARIQASLGGFGRMLADCSSDARSLTIGSVNAQVNPAVPDASLFNGADYEDPADLPDAVDELAATYGEAGVRAWTVWIPEDDAASRELVRGGATCSTPIRRRWSSTWSASRPRRTPGSTWIPTRRWPTSRA